MGMKANFNMRQLSAGLERAEGVVIKNVMRGLRRKGEDIVETASAMAPRDTGALESAFRVTEAVQGRSAIGRFERARVVVYIDPLATNPDTDELVTDYAGIMHDELTPYGDLQLGKKSREKGGEVGGGFLERAIEEHIDEVEETVVDQVSKALTQ